MATTLSELILHGQRLLIPQGGVIDSGVLMDGYNNLDGQARMLFVRGWNEQIAGKTRDLATHQQALVPSRDESLNAAITADYYAYSRGFDAAVTCQTEIWERSREPKTVGDLADNIVTASSTTTTTTTALQIAIDALDCALCLTSAALIEPDAARAATERLASEGVAVYTYFNGIRATLKNAVSAQAQTSEGLTQLATLLREEGYAIGDNETQMRDITIAVRNLVLVLNADAWREDGSNPKQEI